MFIVSGYKVLRLFRIVNHFIRCFYTGSIKSHDAFMDEINKPVLRLLRKKIDIKFSSSLIDESIYRYYFWPSTRCYIYLCLASFNILIDDR